MCGKYLNLIALIKRTLMLSHAHISGPLTGRTLLVLIKSKRILKIEIEIFFNPNVHLAAAGLTDAMNQALKSTLETRKRPKC